MKATIKAILWTALVIFGIIIFVDMELLNDPLNLLAVPRMDAVIIIGAIVFIFFAIYFSIMHWGDSL